MTFDPASRHLQVLESRWAGLFSAPDWYLTVIPETQAFLKELDFQSPTVQLFYKQALYDFFEHHLRGRDFRLGREAGYFDTQRKPIDRIVIHHTSQSPGLTPERLSAIELMRLYGPYFAEPETADLPLKGKAIFSGHLRDGKQVFWPYHWIVRSDGRTERLLNDDEVGWHAGNWELNCRSVGIALDNDYEKDRPSDIVLQATADLIERHYGSVPVPCIWGHREVSRKTLCPSELFLGGVSGRGWKQDIVERILHNRGRRAA